MNFLTKRYTYKEFKFHICNYFNYKDYEKKGLNFFLIDKNAQEYKKKEWMEIIKRSHFKFQRNVLEMTTNQPSPDQIIQTFQPSRKENEIKDPTIEIAIYDGENIVAWKDVSDKNTTINEKNLSPKKEYHWSVLFHQTGNYQMKILEQMFFFKVIHLNNFQQEIKNETKITKRKVEDQLVNQENLIQFINDDESEDFKKVKLDAFYLEELKKKKLIEILDMKNDMIYISKFKKQNNFLYLIEEPIKLELMDCLERVSTLTQISILTDGFKNKFCKFNFSQNLYACYYTKKSDNFIEDKNRIIVNKEDLKKGFTYDGMIEMYFLFKFEDELVPYILLFPRTPAISKNIFSNVFQEVNVKFLKESNFETLPKIQIEKPKEDLKMLTFNELLESKINTFLNLLKDPIHLIEDKSKDLLNIEYRFFKINYQKYNVGKKKNLNYRQITFFKKTPYFLELVFNDTDLQKYFKIFTLSRDFKKKCFYENLYKDLNQNDMITKVSFQSLMKKQQVLLDDDEPEKLLSYFFKDDDDDKINYDSYLLLCELMFSEEIYKINEIEDITHPIQIPLNTYSIILMYKSQDKLYPIFCIFKTMNNVKHSASLTITNLTYSLPTSNSITNETIEFKSFEILEKNYNINLKIWVDIYKEKIYSCFGAEKSTQHKFKVLLEIKGLSSNKIEHEVRQYEDYPFNPKSFIIRLSGIDGNIKFFYVINEKMWDFCQGNGILQIQDKINSIYLFIPYQGKIIPFIIKFNGEF